MISDASPKQFDIKWFDSGHWPKVSPNPNYPKGIDISGVREDEQGCRVALPYPARRIGMYSIRCRLCSASVGLTTAGRPDDPRSIAMPCKLKDQAAP